MFKEEDYITKKTNKIFGFIAGAIVTVVAAQVAFNFHQDIIGFACLIATAGFAGGLWMELSFE